jgi:hypothetical protein
MSDQATSSAPRRSGAPSSDDRTAAGGGEPPDRHDDHAATRNRVLASLLTCPDARTARANGIGATPAP